jgi:copper chaperone CopZ
MDKKLIILGVVLSLIVASLLVLNNAKSSVAGNVIAQDIENLHQANLAIEDMYCEACAYGVKAQIEELDGVVIADIDYKTASGVVKYDADKVNAETIARASTAYPATVVSDEKL